MERMELNLSLLQEDETDFITLEEEFLKMVNDLQTQSVEMEEEGLISPALFSLEDLYCITNMWFL